MGFLTDGRALPWHESLAHVAYVKSHGVSQFLAAYRRCKDKVSDCLLWGDEIEFQLVYIDPETKTVKLWLHAHEVLAALRHEQAELRAAATSSTDRASLPLELQADWTPEYSNAMVEAIPGAPYGENINELVKVEASMVLRRQLLERCLDRWCEKNGLPAGSVRAMTMTAFPLMGVGLFTEPPYAPEGDAGTVSKSRYVPDQVINPHQRFPTLTRNIRERRGRRVCIYVPVHPDGRRHPDGVEPFTFGALVYRRKDEVPVNSPTAFFLPQYFKPAGRRRSALEQCVMRRESQRRPHFMPTDSTDERVGASGEPIQEVDSEDEEVPADDEHDASAASGQHKTEVPVEEHLPGATNGYAPQPVSPSQSVPRSHSQPVTRVREHDGTSSSDADSSGSSAELELDAVNGRLTPPVASSSGSNSAEVTPKKRLSPVEGEQPSCRGCVCALVHMDCMAFGMGMSCLQTTFQCVDMEQSRFVYDQFAVLCPIMLALTANTPILRGMLVDTDVRWHVISASVDDRTPEELELQPDGFSRLPKSRYDSVSCFIANRDDVDMDKLNDIRLEINEEAFERLTAAGVDRLVAQHIAHLFTRDPLVIYENRIELDDETAVDHFENIQSTNWQSARWKIPPPNSNIGWRVEFRVMELAFSDFENAAHAVFVVLLTRAIQHFRLNLYMPMSMVDVNMAEAHRRDAVLECKFHWRKNVCQPGYGEITEYTIHEIINGSTDGAFPGLISIVRRYLGTQQLTEETSRMLDKYLLFISRRASGEISTGAAYIRNFVRLHPKYQGDAVVTPEIAYDVIREIEAISYRGHRPAEMFGDDFSL